MLKGSDLEAIHTAGLIDDAQLAKIAAFLEERRSVQIETQAPRFDLTHVLWYAGACIIIGAMSLFTTIAFNRMGGWALTACGAVYAIMFTLAGDYLWKKKNLRVPGGLLIAVAVSMVPMMIYGIQDALDLWKYAQGQPGIYKNFFPHVHGSWLYMEIATIVAAIIAVQRYPFPFIVLIAAVALWFMSMDLALWFMRSPEDYSNAMQFSKDNFEIRRQVSLWFGAGMIVVAWVTDILREDGPDFTNYIHAFGALAFWAALPSFWESTEILKFTYCLINVLLVGFGVFIKRRIYAVFGALGIASYLGYLASVVFKDMILFSFALSAIGIVIILLGLALNRDYPKIAATLDSVLPNGLKILRPHRVGAL
ncbi:MAG: hypothetical protein ACKOW3_10225 [Hyphomicrobium sp.]